MTLIKNSVYDVTNNVYLLDNGLQSVYDEDLNIDSTSNEVCKRYEESSLPFEILKDCNEDMEESSLSKDGFIGTIQFGNAANDEELMKFKNLVMEFKDIFVSSGTSIPPPMKCELIDIDPGDIKPICLKSRPVSNEVLKKLQKKIEDGLKEGSIRRTTSPWAAPLVIVKKKTGDIRITADYRELNKALPDLKYAVPSVICMLEKFDGCSIFSAMDCASGFTQVPLSKRASEILAFTCPLGNFAITRLSQGYKNSPAIFQSLMNEAFSSEEKPYFDDFAIGAKCFDDYYSKHRIAFEDCRRHGVSLSVEKSLFCSDSIILLGFTISTHGKIPALRNKEKIIDFPEPKCFNEILSFIGLILYYRASIPGFAGRAASLYQMSDSLFAQYNGLSLNARLSFQDLKSKIQNLEVLPFLRESLPYTIILYSNSWSIGSALCQEIDGIMSTVNYTGRVLTPSERKMNLVMIEALSLLHCVKVFEPFLLFSSFPFEVFTRYSSLSWLIHTKTTHGIILNWSIRMSAFNFVVKKVTEKKLGIAMDASLLVLTPEQMEKEVAHLAPINFTPDIVPKSLLSALPINSNCVIITFDGSYSINSGISSHGFCAWKMPEKQFLFGVAEKNAGKTVNESEYYGLIFSLKFVKELNFESVYIIGDSQLIINQVRGTSSVLKDSLKLLHTEVKLLLKEVNVKEFFHAPRNLNVPADQLSRIGRNATERLIFYEASDVFTELENELLWNEISLSSNSIEEGVNEEDQNVCFVVTRSKKNVLNDNILKSISKENELTETNYSSPSTDSEDIENNEQLEPGSFGIFVDNSKFIKDLVNMQRQWLHSSLLLDLINNCVNSESSRYSKKTILKAKATLNDYEINESGVLCRILKDEFSLSEKNASKLLIVIPPGKLRYKIISDCHDSPASGHYGCDKTYKRVKRSFYWKGMQQEIKRYCLSCSICSRTKGDLRKRAPMGSTYIPSRPFEFISLDIVGPFPSSSKRNKYLLVTQCVFSSFIILSPLIDKSAESVSEAYISKVYSRFGSSQLLLSDNGTEFKNNLFIGINKSLRQSNVFTLPYRPQANGKNERSHKSLLASIRSYLIDRKEKCWEKYLPLLELAYNSHERASSGLSPFFIVHNFDPNLPIESLLNSTSSSKNPIMKTFATEQWKRDKINECSSLKKYLNRVMKIEQEERRRIYGKRNKDSEYEIGDLVWLYHDRTYSDEDKESNVTSRKLLVKWHGPFRILSRNGVSYTLDIIGNSKYRNSKLSCRVHRDRLKIAHSPFDIAEFESPDVSNINDLFDSSFLPEFSFEPDESDCDFEVDSIKEHRLIGTYDSKIKRNNQYEFRIRWKGYDPSYDLWLKEEDLVNCKDILNGYLKSELYNYFQQEIMASSVSAINNNLY